MKSFLLALQFLTIIPVKIKHINDKRIAQSMIYFPLVGLFLGLILVAINYLSYILGFARLSIDIILVIFLIILTGGIHLDGLSDSFDAISSRKNKEEMLMIMRDSHAGVFGVLSIIGVVLLKIALLYSVAISLKTTALLLMPVLSRWALVFVIFLFPYARQEGKAKVFIENRSWKIFLISTFLAFISAALIWRINGLLILLIVAPSAYIIAKFINKKICGITGDTLGAINELTEVIVLFVMCILERSSLWII